MEEKKISEKESLKLIMTMINQTKTDDGRHSGDTMLIWLPYDAAWTCHLRTYAGYKHTAMESALVELTLCWFFVVIFI